MKNRVQAFFLVMGGLVIAAGVVYGELKKGYYSPAELGSVRQAAPVELLPDSSYQASAYPVPAVDLTPGDGLQKFRFTATPVTAHVTSPCSRHSRRRPGKPR